MARWMRKNGVSAWETAAQLGQVCPFWVQIKRTPDNGTVCAVRSRLLIRRTEAIDLFLQEVGYALEYLLASSEAALFGQKPASH